MANAMLPEGESEDRGTPSKNRRHRVIAFWMLTAAVWAGCCLLGMLGLSQARRFAVSGQGSPAAQRDWDEWRAEAARQAGGQGPVRRREPKSDEPPTVVLLRDYYGLCTTALVIFSGVLSLTFSYLICGAIAQKTAPQSMETDG